MTFWKVQYTHPFHVSRRRLPRSKLTKSVRNVGIYLESPDMGFEFLQSCGVSVSWIKRLMILYHGGCGSRGNYVMQKHVIDSQLKKKYKVKEETRKTWGGMFRISTADRSSSSLGSTVNGNNTGGMTFGIGNLQDFDKDREFLSCFPRDKHEGMQRL